MAGTGCRTCAHRGEREPAGRARPSDRGRLRGRDRRLIGFNRVREDTLTEDGIEKLARASESENGNRGAPAPSRAGGYRDAHTSGTGAGCLPNPPVRVGAGMELVREAVRYRVQARGDVGAVPEYYRGVPRRLRPHRHPIEATLNTPGYRAGSRLRENRISDDRGPRELGPLIHLPSGI